MSGPAKYRRERRAFDLFLPPVAKAGDRPGQHPIERVTLVEGNARLVLRSRPQTEGASAQPRSVVDWNLSDIGEAIEMLEYLRGEIAANQKGYAR